MQWEDSNSPVKKWEEISQGKPANTFDFQEYSVQDTQTENKLNWHFCLENWNDGKLMLSHIYIYHPR